MNRRSMGGRIYQQQTFKPKLITLKNPQQRKIQYPIKGDTSFEPSEYGRKHYFSPKHSAIHSIIFNEDYKKLMEEKSNILKRLNVDPNFSHQNHREKAMEYRKYTENQGKNNIKMLDSYLNDSIVMDSKVNNSTNPFPPYNIFSSSGGSLNEKVQRGRLFRQGSMNEVLKPFEPLERSTPMGLSRGSSSVMDSPILSRNRSLNFEHSMNRNNSLNAQVILTGSNFPRKINPSNLNSIF